MIAAADGGAERPEDWAEDGDRVLIVSVDRRQLAIPLAAARGVVRIHAVTRVPGAAPWVAGVAAVRGALVAIGDLCVLDGRSRVAAREGLVVLVEDGERLAGLRVAEVVGVHPAELVADALGVRSGRVGLPVGGVARLTLDGATRSAESDAAEVPLLDVRAALDHLFDQDAHS